MGKCIRRSMHSPFHLHAGEGEAVPGSSIRRLDERPLQFISIFARTFAAQKLCEGAIVLSFLTTLQRFRSTQRVRFVYSALVVIAVLGAAFALMMSKGTAEETDSPVVTVVNQQVITKQKLLDKLVAWHGETTLAKLIDEILLVEKAKAEGIDVDAIWTDVDLFILETRLSDPQLTTDLGWRTALARAGYTEDSFRHDIFMEWLLLELLDEEAITVTDEEVEALWSLQYESSFGNLTPEEIAMYKSWLREDLQQQKLSEAVQDLFDELYAQANIQYFLKENGINLDPKLFAIPNLRQSLDQGSGDDLILLD